MAQHHQHLLALRITKAERRTAKQQLLLMRRCEDQRVRRSINEQVRTDRRMHLKMEELLIKLMEGRVAMNIPDLLAGNPTDEELYHDSLTRMEKDLSERAGWCAPEQDLFTGMITCTTDDGHHDE